MTAIDAVLATSSMTRPTFEGELEAAFAQWEAVTNLRFAKARDGEAAQIIIGAQLQPEGWAYANVSYDARAASQYKPITQALICLNPTRPWKVGFDGKLEIYDLRYTLAHEIGHAIGLDHPPRNGQLMAQRYAESTRELQRGDIRGAITLYGPPAKAARAALPAIPGRDSVR